MTQRKPRTPLSPSVIAQIADNVRSLAPLHEAAWAADVPERTFMRWWTRGRNAHEAYNDAVDDGLDTPDETQLLGLCHDLYMTVRHAQAVARVACAARVREGKHGWQGSAWTLERTLPEHYARRDRIEHSGPGGKPMESISVTGEDAVDYLARLIVEGNAKPGRDQENDS